MYGAAFRDHLYKECFCFLRPLPELLHHELDGAAGDGSAQAGRLVVHDRGYLSPLEFRWKTAEVALYETVDGKL